MPKVQFGITDRERGRGYLPELPVVNMYAEAAPTEEGGVVLISRPGLVAQEALGTGPVKALFKRDGVLGSSQFAVSGGNLYRDGVLVGAITGNGPVSLAGYEDYLFIAAGGPLYGFDGTTLTVVAFPDGALVSKVVVGGSRLVAIRADTGQFYWSDVLDRDIDALDFATAESQPDRLFDMVFLDDILMLFGAETVEFWPNTSSNELPFQPLESRVIERGVRATGCVAAFGPTFAWVTNRNEVCIQSEQNIVSDTGLQKRIGESANVSLFAFFIDGAEFLALRLDAETQIYSRNAGTWSRFESYQKSNWIASSYADGTFGSAIDGRTFTWGGFADTNGILERRFRGGFPLNGGGIPVSNIRLRCQVGQAALTREPQAELRVSNDGGRTFDEWEQTGLGLTGEYGEKVEWRGLDMASQPGWLGEFRVTDPIDWQVSEVLINEQWGGR